MSDSISWAPSPLTSRIEVNGPSHDRFLQGLCSNDVVAMEIGAACEAYVPTVQGKVLAHGYLLKEESRVVFAGLGTQSTDLLPHLQKYAMIEDVEVIDHGTKVPAILVWGSEAAAWVAQQIGQTDLPAPLRHASFEFDGETVELFRTTLLEADSFELRGPGVLKLVEGIPSSAESWDTLRILNGFPLHGVDISAEHLAQEVNRDNQAISFKKGCYLGQETVARIDAMGHVNKKLVSIIMEPSGEMPALPATLVVQGKEVGRITSLCLAEGKWRGLGMIRRGMNAAGSKLTCDLGTVEIVA
ncbi:hypothetical protein AB1L30_04235 [Bremerella sp. JC817]|uniref:CAF17-like 4Fe-4S cluster assembly/insertion protein YgfZ n=1 Tax=Bremerella sp. JC817 TaxID=3231756 RepID=UPI00345A33A7